MKVAIQTVNLKDMGLQDVQHEWICSGSFFLIAMNNLHETTANDIFSGST